MGLVSVFLPSTHTKVGCDLLKRSSACELVCDKLVKVLSSRYGGFTRFNNSVVIGMLFLIDVLVRVCLRL